jgi:hypothetical protein
VDVDTWEVLATWVSQGDPRALIPVNAGTIGLTVVFAILLLIGLALGIRIRI